jgi:hypothetical protein
MEVFDSISIDCLNGDSRETGKKAPDGRPDPSVFSTEKNREGIRVGTAIAMLERWPESAGAIPDPNRYTPRATVRFRHWWGKQKRAELLASVTKPTEWKSFEPAMNLGLPFYPLESRLEYSSWPLLTELVPKGFSGIKTARDRDLVSIDLPPLQEKIRHYFSNDVSHDAMHRIASELMTDDGRFDAKAVRECLRKRGQKSDSFTRYCYRPFDVRWLFWEQESKLLDERRAELKPHIFHTNLGMVLAQRTRKGFEPPAVTAAPPSYHVVESVSLWFPLKLSVGGNGEGTTEALELFAVAENAGPRLNLGLRGRNYISDVMGEPEDLFFHILAILHSPRYREENAGALRQNWPRVPLPIKPATLAEGAALGRDLAALLDTEHGVAAVTGLKLKPELKGLGELTSTLGDKAKGGTLEITARWGYLDKRGSVMPGSGHVTTSSVGEGFVDVHLNSGMKWKNIPQAVWAYTLGGYPVLKKWLSYRDIAVLKRPLSSDEAETFTQLVRRIAAILSLHPALDEYYQKCALGGLHA